MAWTYAQAYADGPAECQGRGHCTAAHVKGGWSQANQAANRLGWLNRPVVRGPLSSLQGLANPALPAPGCDQTRLAVSIARRIVGTLSTRHLVGRWEVPSFDGSALAWVERSRGRVTTLRRKRAP